MFIHKQRPTSPAKRWSKYINNRFFKKFKGQKFLHKNPLRGFEFKKTKRKRLVSVKLRHYKVYDRPIYGSKVLQINKLAYANYFTATMIFGGGGLFYHKIPEGYYLLFDKSRKSLFFNQINKLINGSIARVYGLPTASMCFSLKVMRARRGRIAESAGTFCKILWHEYETGVTAMNLPSKKFVRIDLSSQCRLGRVSNAYHNYTNHGNAKNAIKNKKKIISVRGIAMNPVDHPNGGRSNTKQPYKNPWGAVAKKQR